MSVHGQTLIQWLEQFAPKSLAVEGDPVGLQVGSLDKRVEKVMVTLDVTEEVVDEAVRLGANFIIAHHPLFYRPLQQLRTDLPYGRCVEKLIQHNITVYAAHTNLDIAQGGVNDWLADRLGLQERDILAVTGYETLKKLMVFVPREDEARLRQALGDAGAGFIGDYSHCTFRTEGIGTFLPGAGTNPHIGEQGKLEQVEEVKIETVFPASIEKKVLRAMEKAHPYEEVAYDVYVLDQQGPAYGLGRIGYLPEEMSLQQFAEHAKQAFDIPRCRVVGDVDSIIKKVAVLGGSGSKYTSKALFRGADVYVTGDVDYHTAVDARRDGLNVVDPGHHVEKVMVDGVVSVLKEAAGAQKQDVEIVGSTAHTDPFSFL